jgi:hypothetical protein
MAAGDILQDLIDIGLLSSWNIINDKEFNFRLDGNDKTLYKVKHELRKSIYFKEYDSQIDIVELIAVRDGQSNHLKFTLGGEDDPDEVQAWIITTILSRHKYSSQITSLMSRTIKKLRKKKFKELSRVLLVDGEFHDKYGERWMIVQFNSKNPILFFVETGNSNMASIMWRFKNKKVMNSSTNIVDVILSSGSC